MKIKKAKLTASLCVEASFFDEDGNDINFKGKNQVHPDLRESLKKLVPYLAELTEQREADLINWDDLESEDNKELLKRLSVTSVSLGGSDESQFAVVVGQRTLLTRKVLNLCAPATEIYNVDNEWELIDDFRDAINAFFYEVELYIREKKWSVAQKELDFEEAGEAAADSDAINEDPFAGAPDLTADVEPITSDVA